MADDCTPDHAVNDNSETSINLARLTEGLDVDSHHDHGGGSTSTRSFESDVGLVEIETIYAIRINGQEFPDPLHVADDGSVHYHGLPQYSAPSALDLMRRVVQAMSGEDPPELLDGPTDPQHHPELTDIHRHEDM